MLLVVDINTTLLVAILKSSNVSEFYVRDCRLETELPTSSLPLSLSICMYIIYLKYIIREYITFI